MEVLSRKSGYEVLNSNGEFQDCDLVKISIYRMTSNPINGNTSGTRTEWDMFLKDTEKKALSITSMKTKKEVLVSLDKHNENQEIINRRNKHNSRK